MPRNDIPVVHGETSDHDTDLQPLQCRVQAIRLKARQGFAISTHDSKLMRLYHTITPKAVLRRNDSKRFSALRAVRSKNSSEQRSNKMRLERSDTVNTPINPITCKQPQTNSTFPSPSRFSMRLRSRTSANTDDVNTDSHSNVSSVRSSTASPAARVPQQVQITQQLLSETCSTEFQGILSDSLVSAIRKSDSHNENALPVEQSNAMRLHRMSVPKSKRRREAYLRDILRRRRAANPRLGVISFSDARTSLPDEHKLEYPVLSDPNNYTCPYCGAVLWKEEVINCCSDGDFAVPPLEPLCEDANDLLQQPSFLKNQRKRNSLFAFTALGASSAGCWQGPSAPSMLTMCGKAYRRIFDAENMYSNETRPPTNNARFYVYDDEQSAQGQSLGIPPDITNALRDLLARKNSWVESYRSAVDEIVRNDASIPDAQICFGPVNRTTHGPILGDVPSTSEIAACIFQENGTSKLFRKVYTFPRNSDSGRPRFVPIFSSTYEPLGYPLLFFAGDAGWSKGTWIPGEGNVGITLGPTGKKVPLGHYVRQRLLSEPVFSLLSRVT